MTRWQSDQLAEPCQVREFQPSRLLRGAFFGAVLEAGVIVGIAFIVWAAMTVHEALK